MTDASTDATASHWDEVYATKDPAEVSWFQRTPAMSHRLVAELEPPPSSLIDVGAGASVFVDELLDADTVEVAVLDVAARALDVVRDRLGERADAVEFITADVRGFAPARTYDVWHDRAVFHFLTDPADQQRYVEVAARAVTPGGAAVIGSFAPDGPTQCSGLETLRLHPDDLAERFAPWFHLARAEREVHRTPWDAEQAFTWVVLRRVAAA
ncbi:MAG: class I SAM-dependent methyltransferase [Nitriliruptoraceae bacterium]|nr:class I SAM-dependent methyltransferase [Nitriliruptoraceae bacterium]